jgi:hypothetical protein
MRDSSPNQNEPELHRAADPARERLRRSTAGQSASAHGAVPARGTSYTDRPRFGDRNKVTRDSRKKTRSGWLIVALIVATLTVSGLIWKQESLPHSMHPWSAAPQQQQTLTLTRADIDYAATAAARAALSRGEIPPILAHADPDTRRKILSGEENLYTKRLIEETQGGILVHARVSSGGVFLGEDILTAERPQGTTFPAGAGAPTHFHFTVEKAGPNGVVSCYINSVNGASVGTRAMAAGESADLEVITR